MFSWKKKTAYRKSKAHKTTWTCTISNFLPLKKLDLRSHWLHDASIIQKLACKCFRGEDKERMGHCLHGLGCCSEIANLWPFNHRTLCLVLGSIGHLGIRKYVFCWSLMHNWNTHTLYCWAGKTYRIHGSLLACWFVCWLKLADVVWSWNGLPELNHNDWSFVTMYDVTRCTLRLSALLCCNCLVNEPLAGQQFGKVCSLILQIAPLMP